MKLWIDSRQVLSYSACKSLHAVCARPLTKTLTGHGLIQVFKSGDEDSDSGMSVEDYPSQEVILRVQLQRAIEEERSVLHHITAVSTVQHGCDSLPPG